MTRKTLGDMNQNPMLALRSLERHPSLGGAVGSLITAMTYLPVGADRREHGLEPVLPVQYSLFFDNQKITDFNLEHRNDILNCLFRCHFTVLNLDHV